MKFIYLIKSVFKRIKITKSTTFTSIIWQFLVLLFSVIAKNYKLALPFLRLFKVLKIWSLISMVLSLTYTLLSSLFNFQYDHKFMVALIMGLGLLFKEYMFDINDWIIRILNRMGTLLQSKVETNNKILTQDTIDKFKRGNITHRPRTLNEYINFF